VRVTVEQAKKELAKAGQAHVLRFWDILGAAERDALLAQIDEIDFGEVARMKRMLAGRNVAAAVTPRPAPVVKWSRRTYGEAFAEGEAQLRKGRVAVLLVAGGQGSRLGYDGPKGAYGIGPVSGMPLFYFHARKIVRLARLYGKPVPFYIMTSDVNDAATRACFEDHDYFGLNPADVIFFKQGVWPALDAEGRLILADALAWAAAERPERLLEFSTLTGACAVALGQRTAGLFSPDDQLAGDLLAAATATGERLWRLPLWPEFLEEMRGAHADLRNSGGRWGGASTAAAFLSQFVGDLTSWAHLDIAGPAYVGGEDRSRRGATGYGVATAIQWLSELASRESVRRRR